MSAATTKQWNPVPIAAFVVVMFISGFFMTPPDATFSTPFFFNDIVDFSGLYDISSAASYILGTFFTLLTAAIFIPIVKSAGSGNIYFPSLIFLSIVVSNPLSIHFSPYHVEALCLAAAISQYAAITGWKDSAEHYLYAGIFLSVGVCFNPHFFWAALLILAISLLARTEDFSRTLVASILSFIFPFAVVFALKYISGGFHSTLEDFRTFLSQFIEKSPETNFHFSVATLARISAWSILTFICAITRIKFIQRYNTARRLLLFKIMGLLPVILAVTLIFASDSSYPYILPVAVPVTLILNDSASSEKPDRRIITTWSIVIAISLFERISYLL
ncbi:MAG: hypothetical protein KBT00_07485 [Bacteroidales bacterium]|nr:hypothetical protein [Candidatus Cacconaster merdequi]